MGKMKEIYMEMVEKEQYETQHGTPPEPIDTDIKCPNCMKGNLMFIAVDDVVCYEAGCGQTYVLVDANTVRFK
jgi:hypothetical protein|tara:strand:- start:797 stop:1015 length:219 start_codon:yes stop_codon:yes gene_type:complete